MNEEDHRRSNSQKLGAFVAETMERLDQDYPDAELGDILIICELQRTDEEGGYTTTRFTCTDGRQHIHLGMLRMAQIAAELP